MRVRGPVPSAPPVRARLSRVLLLYYLGVVLVVTLAPFHFSTPHELQIHVRGGLTDMIANVLLFVPLGFLFPLTRSAAREASPWLAFGLGLLVSLGIETVQIFEPDRYPSVPDVLTNATGAGLGMMLQQAAARRIEVNARLVGRLSLELPLMGLVYLLVPLLWLGSLGAGENAAGYVPLLLLGAFGARLLGDLQRYHFGPAGVLGRGGVAAVAGAWALVGTFLAVWRHPVLCGAVVIVAAAVAYATARPVAEESPDRRFEVRTLRWAAPYLAGYFLLFALLPLAAGIGDWSGAVGFPARINPLSKVDQLRLLEPMAALTVLGYLLAEARGRREQPFGEMAPRLAVECGLMAVGIELLRGFQASGSASLAHLLLLIVLGVFGGWLYYLQREHVRGLVAARESGFAVQPARRVSNQLAGS